MRAGREVGPGSSPAALRAYHLKPDSCTGADVAGFNPERPAISGPLAGHGVGEGDDDRAQARPRGPRGSTGRGEQPPTISCLPPPVHQPEDLPGGRERGIGQCHPAAALGYRHGGRRPGGRPRRAPGRRGTGRRCGRRPEAQVYEVDLLRHISPYRSAAAPRSWSGTGICGTLDRLGGRCSACWVRLRSGRRRARCARPPGRHRSAPQSICSSTELEHPPRRVASAERERERAALGDRRPGGLGDQLRPAARAALHVVALDRVRQSFFSSWPPNCFRIAESTLSAKSSRPRGGEARVERRAEHRRRHALLDRGDRGPAALARVRDPSIEAREVGRSCSAAAVRSSSHEPTDAAAPPDLGDLGRRCRIGRTRVLERRVSASASAVLTGVGVAEDVGALA